jgi:hypothetical protein
MILTEWQKREFETLGFLVLPQLFSPEELEQINQEFERGRLQMTAIGLQPVGVRRQLNWTNLRPNAPFLSRLPEDDRLSGVAEQLLGPDAFMVHCNSNQLLGTRTEWHPDARNPSFRAFKFALYLQPLREDTGALRVIPGSHLSCFSRALGQLQLGGANIGEDNSYLDLAGKSVRDIPCHVCITNPGDMILFDLRLWHASWGGGTRSLVSSDFHAYPRSAEERDAELEFRDFHRGSMQTFRSPQPQYGPEWLKNAEGNARRTRWIEILDQLGYLRPLDTGIEYNNALIGGNGRSQVILEEEGWVKKNRVTSS